ncbi:hypothetical protein ASG40_10870 [Methylobacterium sp. Leaf399]|uniref:DUF29 domain-containing protein n=1 Tax=Methylobacterium sp. Leaf399 TaxID=1736364 RepID=UPI0006FEADAC|nr:DUF29 domain-containing protein [Methylobacterium sp. Leaf399]KQT09142.1 hypothetical protein ASG40_10870 [Methylobacterium sp. Leaf399]
MGEPALKGAPLTDGASPSGGRTRHEDDLFTWVQEQVALLRAGAVETIDVANIAEELNDVGAEQYDRLESALEVLLMHMLKWDHQPERRSRSWVLTIIEQRKRVDKVLRKNPGLRPRIAEAVEDGFDLGRVRAAREMKRDLDTLPDPCPYDWDAITSRPFSLAEA